MHDLLLFGQIPESRFEQLTNILAGLTALPEPRRILERRYVFRPNRGPVQKVEQLGGSQNITDVHKLARRQRTEEEPRYSTLIEDLTLVDDNQQSSTHAKSETHTDSTDDTRASAPRFSLHTTDVPEPEIRAVVSRARTANAIIGDDALASVEAQGQRFLHQYIVEGLQFVFNSVVIRIQRCMQLIPKASDTHVDSHTAFSAFALKPWDKSGAYMLQASVTLLDGKNPELVASGTEELKRLKEDLRGCVELRTVERLSMDPRVK